MTADPDLIGLQQIAELGRFKRQRAEVLVARDDFPSPALILPGGVGRRLWSRRDVAAWLEAWEEQSPKRRARLAALAAGE